LRDIGISVPLESDRSPAFRSRFDRLFLLTRSVDLKNPPFLNSKKAAAEKVHKPTWKGNLVDTRSASAAFLIKSRSAYSFLSGRAAFEFDNGV